MERTKSSDFPEEALIKGARLKKKPKKKENRKFKIRFHYTPLKNNLEGVPCETSFEALPYFYSFLAGGGRLNESSCATNCKAALAQEEQ